MLSALEIDGQQQTHLPNFVSDLHDFHLKDLNIRQNSWISEARHSLAQKEGFNHMYIISYILIQSKRAPLVGHVELN